MAEPGGWWLVQADIAHRLNTLRGELGSSFGWTDPLWYTARAKLEKLYAFIEQQGNQDQLFADLEQATDDDRRQ